MLWRTQRGRLPGAALSPFFCHVATIEPIESLHADDFVLVPPPGFPLTKPEYLGAVGSGAID